MWKVAMSEEVGKALQSVVDRVNQAAARRPKVTSAARAAPRYVRPPDTSTFGRQSLT